MPTATALDLISASLTELNVLAAGEVATSADALLGLAALNRLIDQWQAENLMLFAETRTTWTIVSGTQDYTVGTGGTVNVARPVFIDHVNFQDTSTDPDTEHPTSSLTDDAWAAIPQKALTSPMPSCSYFNDAFPLATLSFWPVPTSTTLQGVLYAKTALSELSALTTSILLPPGGQRMIVKNLAAELAPSYSRQPDQLMMMQAADAKRVFKVANKRLMDLSFDLGAMVQGSNGRFQYDIRTGP